MISAIALDLGTTAIKAGLLDSHGALGHIVARAAPHIAVSGGRYESDALAYAEAAEQVLAACVADAGGCTTLGLCSQRSSFLIWEQSTGQPLTPLISWQDDRGAASCDALRNSEGLIRELTGLPLAPYYFAPKLRVVLQENPDWLARLVRGELRVGTLDTFLIWRRTGGKHYITDASMAARTLLMDIRRECWSPELCELFGIPLSILPEIMPSTALNFQLMKLLTIRLGNQTTIAKSLVMNNGLTLQASVGDQSAALIAAIREDRAEALVNLGTGGFVVRYLPEGQIAAEGYLSTLVYLDARAHVAAEGTLNSIAAALAPYPAAECSPADLASDDIFCLAEPSGLGAPYLHSGLGLRFSRPVEHLPPRRIAALLLEAVIFRVARILEDFHRDFALERVYLSGGLSELACLQQGIAQCVPFEVYRLDQRESSLQGAALLAAGIAPACKVGTRIVIPDNSLAATSPPPCRGRVREGVETPAFHSSTPILAFPLQGGRNVHGSNEQSVFVESDDTALPEKYSRWKAWLDGLLAQKASGT